MELPSYQSHKIVQAAKIEEISGSTDVSTGKLSVTLSLGWLGKTVVSPEWNIQHYPKVGGYFVQYDDGYQSYSPAEAFENGYTPINEDKPRKLTGPTPPAETDKFRLNTAALEAALRASLAGDADHILDAAKKFAAFLNE